jgi:hypothetical protein
MHPDWLTPRCRDNHTRRTDGRWVRGTAREVFAGTLASNGVLMVRARCEDCGERSNFIPHTTLAEWGVCLDDVPVERVHGSEPCSVRGCDRTGSEWHHWAPRSVFGVAEAEQWPKSHLCRAHHDEWHRSMDGYSRNKKGAA